MSYLYPAIPDDQKLWRNDPTLRVLATPDARKEVNELFKAAILEIAGAPPPRSTIPPFHQGHAVKEVTVCYGASSPIDRVGVWYAKCTCHVAVKWLHRAVPETDLFFSERLRRLLFMRKELKPKPKNDKTATEAYKISIERSICYRSAFSDMYPSLASQVYRASEEDGTPPSSTIGSSPAKSLPVNARKRPATGGSPVEHPTKRQSCIVPESTSAPTAARSLQSPIKRQRHSFPTTASNATASSSQPTSVSIQAVDRVPVFIVAWIQNGVDPVIMVARTRSSNMFSLVSQKHILKANGITRSAFPHLERYTTAGTWNDLPWDATFGPVQIGQPVLLRVRGLSNLADFVWTKVLVQA